MTIQFLSFVFLCGLCPISYGYGEFIVRSVGENPAWALGWCYFMIALFELPISFFFDAIECPPQMCLFISAVLKCGSIIALAFRVWPWHFILEGLSVSIYSGSDDAFIVSKCKETIDQNKLRARKIHTWFTAKLIGSTISYFLIDDSNVFITFSFLVYFLAALVIQMRMPSVKLKFQMTKEQFKHLKQMIHSNRLILFIHFLTHSFLSPHSKIGAVMFQESVPIPILPHVLELMFARIATQFSNLYSSGLRMVIGLIAVESLLIYSSFYLFPIYSFRYYLFFVYIYSFISISRSMAIRRHISTTNQWISFQLSVFSFIQRLGNALFMWTKQS